MKTKIAFIALVIGLASFTMFAQSIEEETSPMLLRTINNAGPPTFATTVSDLAIKVWIMTQEEHKRMMETANNQSKMYDDKEGNSGNMDMDTKTMSTASSGTHHIKVEVDNPESGEARNGLDTKVKITSPSKKSWWINLKNISDHYGSDLSLKEKGPYMFTINIDDNGTTKSTQFKYTVQ
jgi:hypothetical protein